MVLSRSFGMTMVMCVCSHLAGAQTSSTFDITSPAQIFQPSSNATAMVRVNDIPVSYYTGKPQISFPIYQIVSGPLKHNISLDYTGSGGIPVAAEGSWAGLGWDLTLGGVFARTINGRPDERTNTPIGYTSTAASMGIPLWTDPNSTNWLSTLDNCEKWDLAESRKDLLPDAYYVSFAGQNAKLVYDRNGNLFFATYKPWKVAGNILNGFVITIENGTKYEFKTQETTTADVETLPGDGGAVFTYNSAWFLTRIVSPTLKDTITFNYTAVTFTNDDELPSETRYTPYGGQTAGCSGSGVGSESSSFTYSKQTMNTHVLSSIVYRTGKIEFGSVNDRQDIGNGNKYRLREIRLYMAKGLTYSLFKTIRFNLNYSNSASSNTLLKRMFLSSFTEVGGNDSLTYSFGYIDSAGLPAKNSMAQDHWGYYNGANGNTTLIASTQDDWLTYFYGANREPDSVAMQKGLLSWISYPSGGRINFQYEPHYYSFEGNNPLYKPAGLDSLQRDTFVTATTYGTHPFIYSDTTAVFVPDLGQGFQGVSITYAIQGQIVGDPQASATLYKDDWTVLTGYGNTTTGYTIDYALTAGKWYYLVAERVGTTERSSIRLNYKYYNKFSRAAIHGFMAGGNRILRITKFDGLDHANDMVARFKYTLNDSVSSGVLLNMPKYQDITRKPYYCNLPPAGNVKGGDYLYFTRYGSSVVPLGRTQGSPIGYSRVTMFHGENGENGSEVMNYTISGLADSGGNGYPYIPKTSRDELRGLLLSTRTFDSENRLVRSITNEYSLNNTAGSPNLRWLWGAKVGASKVSTDFDGSGCPGSSWLFISGMYQVFQFWPTIKSITDSSFNVNNGTFLTQKTSLFYDSVNAQITRKDVTGSDNVTSTTLYSYAKNFAGTAVYDSMVARNIVAEVVEQIQQRAGVQYSREKTNFGFSNGMIAPLNKAVIRSADPVETRLQFYGYDNSGNLLEQGKTDDVHEVYLWGYNHQFPVAEIRGAAYAAVIGLLDTTVLKNPASDAALRTEVQKIRTALSGSSAQVKTMTYSPFGLVTSLTDASGTTTYYEYDGLGRLITVKDHMGMILRHYRQKYQRPITE